MYSYLYHSYTYKIKTLSKLFIDDKKFNQDVSKSRHRNKVNKVGKDKYKGEISKIEEKDGIFLEKDELFE